MPMPLTRWNCVLPVLIGIFFALVLFVERCVTIQYTPIAPNDITDCALVLTGSFDSSDNILQSAFGSPLHCITYDAINEAFLKSRKQIKIPEKEDNWKPEDVAAIGNLILGISTEIASLYDLSLEDIEYGLPQIDTSRTLIKDICPAYLSTIRCKAGRYRRHDGLCNNAKNPSWGATMTPFTRLLPAMFSDRMSQPRMSVTGNTLPSARIVSRTMHPDEGYHDHASTVMVVAWGQFMDHDFTLMGTPLDARNKNEPEECCYRPEHLKNPYCLEIAIPEDDYFYQKYHVRCQDFVRALPGIQPDCKLGTRTPFNTLTAVIDGNTIYGVNEDFARYLRSGVGGQLKMNPAFTQYGLKDLLPPKVDIPDEGCVRTNSSQHCFLAGEIRVNEQLVLSCIHTLMAREHNRLAAELARVNPHWDDEILYQEARRITIAEIQHITFNEFLPLLLGKEVMEKYGLVLQNHGYWNGYDEEVNPNIMDAFSSAAFRFGHSLLPSAIERWSKAHRFIASKRLSELIRRPYDLYRVGVIDEYFVGLMNQVAQAMDDSITQEVTNHLLKKPGNYFGLDLVSFNIQRGRDFGLPGYMHFRQKCGLDVAEDFSEMLGNMPNSTVQRFMSIYDHPNDIDLWSGGVSEKPVIGSMIGPTFACIIGDQMSRIKKGDRFWYELPNQPSSFTLEQLQEIRKVKLARVICDNTDLIDTVQIYPMVLPDHDINPRVSCKSSVLPSLDLRHWADLESSGSFDEELTSTSIVQNSESAVNKCRTCGRTDISLLKPSGYEYHVKTIAIIEGGDASIDINELTNPADGSWWPNNYNPLLELESPQAFKRLVKRSAEAAENNLKIPNSDDIFPNQTTNKNITFSSTFEENTQNVDFNNAKEVGYHVINETSTEEYANSKKNVTKRHSAYKKGPSAGENQMTQAIMKDDGANEESFHLSETGYKRPSSYRQYEDEDVHDIENVFRNNVPIFDGVKVPRFQKSSSNYKRYYPQSMSKYSGRPKVHSSFYFEKYKSNPEKDEEEPSDGIFDVDDDHNAQYEYVPMDIDEDGKQVSKKPFGTSGDEDEQEEDHGKSRYQFPEKYQSNYEIPKFNSFSNVRHEFPKNYDFSQQVWYPKLRDESPFNTPYFSSLGEWSHRQPTVGISHQFNSIADDVPRYYKHYRPDQFEQSESYKPNKNYQYDANYESDDSTFDGYRKRVQSGFDHRPDLPSEFSNSGVLYKRRSPSRSSYNGLIPFRTTHVPRTLEEYHRIHGTDEQEIQYPSKEDAEDESEGTTDYDEDGSPGYETPHYHHNEGENEETHKAPKSFMSFNLGPSEDDDSPRSVVQIRHKPFTAFKPCRRIPYKFDGNLDAIDIDTSKFSNPNLSRDEFFKSFEPSSNVPFSSTQKSGSSRSKRPDDEGEEEEDEETNIRYNYGDKFIRKQEFPQSRQVLLHRLNSHSRRDTNKAEEISALHEDNLRLYENMRKTFETDDKNHVIKKRSADYEDESSSKENVENDYAEYDKRRNEDEYDSSESGKYKNEPDESVEESSMHFVSGYADKTGNHSEKGDDNDEFWNRRDKESFSKND